MMSEKKTKDEAYNLVTSILVDEGFDIKMGNKDIGLVTTEYKKFGAFGDDPPFDLYLQIKVKVAEVPNAGKIKLTVTPLVKQSNRLNAAAFTEEPLHFFDEEMQKGYLSSDQKAYLQGYLRFNNVMMKISETLGLDMKEIQMNIQQQSKSLM